MRLQVKARSDFKSESEASHWHARAGFTVTVPAAVSATDRRPGPWQPGGPWASTAGHGHVRLGVRRSHVQVSVTVRIIIKFPGGGRHRAAVPA